MNKKKKRLSRLRLPLLFATIVFIIMQLAMFLVFILIMLFSNLGFYQNIEQDRMSFFFFGLVSLLVGSVLAAVLSQLPLRPLQEIMAATDKIADGDYSVRLALKNPKEFRDLSRKFNHMAEELGSVEMLRTDFVNDFSHEFKTPIVSIRGFAKMLKYDDLTDDERNEYLDIIVQESERLADLSANVLNLSKIEQQTILTDKSRLNLSEQIRSCIAIMDSKWSEKKVEFQMFGHETYLLANESLLEEVWLNLLDNAIKFSADGGIVKIIIHQYTEYVTVEISNQGEPIPEETARHIFDKFYQGDASHATKGNGLGLAIAKKIVELHKGAITVESQNGQWVTFDVRLPRTLLSVPQSAFNYL